MELWEILLEGFIWMIVVLIIAILGATIVAGFNWDEDMEGDE